MSGLSEVSILVADKAVDLEAAREVFSIEIREFVQGVLSSLRRTRAEPWVTSRVRIDLPRDLDSSTRSSGRITEQCALAHAELRFRRDVRFMPVGEITFGIEFEERDQRFVWRVTLVPSAKYQRLDDQIWAKWKANSGEQLPPGSAHFDKANTVRFVTRPLTATLSPETAFNDAKLALDFVAGAEAALINAIGSEPIVSESSGGAVPAPTPSAPAAV